MNFVIEIHIHYLYLKRIANLAIMELHSLCRLTSNVLLAQN